MREHEMRMRVEGVLQVWRRRALVPAFGIGMTVGGCATGRSVEAGPMAHPTTEAEPVGALQRPNGVAIYSAPVPPEPEPEPEPEFDPAPDFR